MLGCQTNNPAIRRYTLRFALVMALYILFLSVTVSSFAHHHPTGLVAYLLAILPGLPIVASIVVVGLYLAEEKDEFQRSLFVQAMLWALGATLSITTIWGFLELFVAVPHLQLYLLYPIFWCIVGVAGALLRMRYK